MAAKKKAKTTKPSTKSKKKATAKKLKAPAKKKAVKTIPDPHQGKRYFMLEFGGYGGEFIVAKTSEKFVQYWLDESRENTLDDHVMAMHEKATYGDMDEDTDNEDNETNNEESGGFDPHSPEVSKGVKYIEYWELGDIEHDTVLSKDSSSFTVQEITLSPKAIYKDGTVDWDDKESSKKNFDWSQEKFTFKEGSESVDYNSSSLTSVYCQEMFVVANKEEVEKPVPVLMCYDAQKGTFFRLFVETNGEDFDVEKLIVGVNENTMTEHMTEFFYDKRSLSQDHDWLSTWGKGFSATVGYMSQHDIKFNREKWLKIGWKELANE